MTVYHGSVCEIRKPDVALAKPRLDFGRAFYLTTFRRQAERWALRKAARTRGTSVVTVYRLANDFSDFRLKDFGAADGDAGDDAPFISDERVDEGWTVTPIGHKPGEPVPADFDPYEDDDDDDDPPFYTEEDYRNMPVLRRILQDLGGEDPLAGEEEGDADGGDDRE